MTKEEKRKRIGENPIKLDDLLPPENVKGGKDSKFIFGVLGNHPGKQRGTGNNKTNKKTGDR